MIICLVSIICLGCLFASSAEAAVKTYYAQQDGTCGSNNGSGLIWQSAAEGGSNCGSRSRIGGRDAAGDFLIAVTPVYASETTITGQAGSNIYFQEAGRGVAIGEAQLVEVNAAGNAILTYFSGGPKNRSYDSNSGSITDLSAQSGTINAGNRLGMLVSVNNTDGGEINFYYGQSGGSSSQQAWFVVDEVVANSAPTLTVNQPDGVGDSVDPGNSFSIGYNLADSDDTVTAAFYYDTNNGGLDGTAISGACASAAEGTGATCSWNTTGIPSGMYYVYGITNDGTNPAVSDYSSGQITINACSESITSSIIWNGTNSANGDFNASSFITANDVNTLQYQVTEDGGPGTVSQITAWTDVYNGAGSSGLTVGTPNVTNGSAEKMMFVYLAPEGGNITNMTATYGGQSMTLAGSQTTTSTGNPSFVFWLNAADIDARSGNNLVVTANGAWSRLKVAYSLLDGADQSAPVSDFQSAGYASTGSSTWSVPAMAVGAGELVISGSNHQRSNADVNWSLSPAEFTLNYENYSTSNSAAAATRNNTNANAALAINWVAGTTSGSHKSVWAMAVKAAGGEATVISWTADAIPAIANLTDGNTYNLYARGTEAECSVDTYYGDSVANTTADGVAQSFTWTPTPPNSAATLAVNEPDGASDIIAEDGNFTVNYDLSDSDDVTTVSFFFETDGNGAGGTAIGSCSAQPEATGGTCVWNTSGVTPGNYYVYGTTSGDGAGAATVVSSGTMRINDTVTLVVNQPDGAGDIIAEGGNFTINYNLSDNDDVTTVAFFYDTNNSGTDGTAIGSCAAEPEATGGTCVWNTSGVAPGNYYVYGTTSGDWAGAATVYSSGTMTINEAPALSVLEPNGTGDTVTVGDTFNITYTLTDADNSITAAFYYDTNNSGFNGTAIGGACTAAAEGSGVTCAWNTSGVPAGSYYVYGISSTDPYNTATQAYSPGQITISSNSVATLVVNQPDGTGDTIAEDGNFTINYNLSDSDDVTTVAFFYDTNNSGTDGSVIAGCGTEPEATGGTCVWDTTGIAPGNYYIYGTTSGDGAGTNTIYSSGTMTVNEAPALSISEPNGSGDAVALGDVYNITYTLTDANDTITAAFYYDNDAVGFDGSAITGACSTAAEGTAVTCAWDTSGMTSGDYYVYGISTTDAFSSPAQAYSPGVITINSAATLAVSQPDGAGDTIAEGGTFTVNYDLSDSDDVTTVSFFYETDGNGAGGTTISSCGTQPEATGGTCYWDTTGVTPGSYYVYGTTNGDGVGTATVVSSGTMMINDAPALSIAEPNGSGDTVGIGNVYNITYTLSDSDDTITAAFYYDTNNSGFDGTAISGTCASAAEGSGVTCAWDTNGMTPGNYYVYGISTTDAYNSVAQSYSLGMITINANSTATLVVNEPNGSGDTISQGGNFTINYNLSDSDDVTTVAFFYDTNNSGVDGIAIGGCNAAPEATGGTCVWNTGVVAPGSYYIYGTTSGDGAGATTVYSSGMMTINASPFRYASGDDGTNPGEGDSIAGVSRKGGGDDSDNYESGKAKINVEYEFTIVFTDDSGESPLVEPKLYLAHKDAPTEGAGGDFFVYPLVCTGDTWGSGKTCSTTMKLGPAASHKFYFYAEKTDGTILRRPESGYTDGPEVHLLYGYSLAGLSRDIDGSNLDSYAAFNNYYSYSWDSLGLDIGGIENGNWLSVTSSNPPETGRGYFVHHGNASLPQHGAEADVTAASHTITLSAGWNLISNPYNGNVKLDDVQIRQVAGSTNTWSDAAGANWIEPAVYYFLGEDWGDTNTSEFGPEAELVPWMGYWMYVKDDVNSYELIITKPAQ